MRYKIRVKRKISLQKKVLLTEIVSKVELTVRYHKFSDLVSLVDSPEEHVYLD
jgi:hypothetical protein